MQNRIPLLILGVHNRFEGYPNIVHRLAMLAHDERLAVQEINCPFAPERMFHQQRSSRFHLLNKAMAAARGLAAHVAVFVRFMASGWRQAVYIPYPAAGVAYLFSLLPRSLHPAPLFCDAFISVYDTMVHDRQLIKHNSLAARLLKHIEKRAFTACSRVLVDTDANRRYLADLFDLPPGRFVPLALATNEDDYRPQAYQPQADRCRVLFVGTFVPLQGVGTIAEAIRLLADEKDIEFVIIGTGQESAKFEQLLAQEPAAHLRWIRTWQDTPALAAHIAEADICLGIFGAGDKTQRVWPYKNYLYMSVGRAIVTGKTPLATAMSRLAGDLVPFLMVPVNDPQALADTLRNLARDPQQRRRLAEHASQFYEDHLANTRSHAALVHMITSEAKAGS